MRQFQVWLLGFQFNKIKTLMIGGNYFRIFKDYELFTRILSYFERTVKQI